MATGAVGIGSSSTTGANGSIAISGGMVTATGDSVAGTGIGGGTRGDNILIYGEATQVTAKGASGAAGDIYASTLFIALPPGNLTLSTPPATTANAVLFTADPASTGAVTAALPAPFGTTINLLTGLDTTGKPLSVITTLFAETVSFALDGYGNSPIVKTGNGLMNPGAKIAFVQAAIPTPPPPVLTPQAITGDWYDPAYDGSGFNILMTGSGLSLFYYGGNGWLESDVGPKQIVPGTSITLNMNQTYYDPQGGSSFLNPPKPTSLVVWGTVTLNFSADGATAVATLAGSDGKVNLYLQKLAGMASTPSVTGDWFDPAYDGSGFNVTMTPAGLLLFYYGWSSDFGGPFGPLWLISDVGPTQITAGNTITLNMNQTNYYSTFLSPAKPNTLTQWGTVQLTFLSCSPTQTATAKLSGVDGTVNLNLMMLANVVNLPPEC
jgi:hypothetical protein